MKLKNLISENVISEKRIMDDYEINKIAREIVMRHFVSKTNPDLISTMQNGVEQNLLLKNLQSSIRGAIKSVISNYKGTFHMGDREDAFKQ
jgi:hypothetical protein